MQRDYIYIHIYALQRLLGGALLANQPRAGLHKVLRHTVCLIDVHLRCTALQMNTQAKGVIVY